MTDITGPQNMRRVLVLALVAALLASTVTAATLIIAPSKAQASPTGNNFDPAYIISDENFWDYQSMTVSDIQDFLDEKGPANCDNCLREYRGNTYKQDPTPTRCANPTQKKTNVSAAQIIYDVARACEINPQVLLVTLQKEMSLVTMRNPAEWRYNIAMGYACPDTAPCDETYFGFFHQLYSGAGQFNRYSDPSGPFTWIPYGGSKSRSVAYHPNSSCGSSKLFIKNRATAALYYYTPYQPNQAALNNLYGTGNSCSSYGNRNFWTFFYNWFGNPTGVLNAAPEPEPTPTPTPTPTPSATPSPEPSATPSPDPSTAPSPEPEPTTSPSPSPTPSTSPSPDPEPEPDQTPEPEPEPEPTVSYLKHRVKSGDTVWDLARRYDSTVSAIIEANNLNSRALIRTGQDLRIPVAGSTADSGSEPPAADPTPTPDPTPKPATVTHRVKSGDTVWGLARRYDSTVSAIIKANNLNSRALIRPGQQLTIPGASNSSGAPSSNSGSSSGGSSGSSQSSATTHTVKSGDTVWDLARRYKSSVGAIISANDLNSRALIRPGQKLTIPAR